MLRHTSRWSLPPLVSRQARRRRVAAVALTAVALTSVAACSAGTGGGSDGQVTVEWLSWDDAAVVQPLVDAFEASHPDINVEISNAADVSQYQSQLQPRLLSGTAPDIFVLGSPQEFVDAGHVADLSDEELVERLSPANVEYAAVDDRVYGVSISSWGGGLAYNAEALAEVGVAGPDDFPQSWDELLELLADLEAAGWDAPILESNTDGPSSSICGLSGLANAAAGGDLDAQVYAGETTWAEHWTEPWEEWMRLIDEGYLTRDTVGLSADQVNQEFVTEKTPVIASASWAMKGLADLEPPFEVSFMPIPGLEGGTNYLCGAASPALSVNAASDVKEEAIQFLDFLTTPEAAKIYNESSGSITTTEGFTPTVDPALEPIVPLIQEGKIYLPVVAWRQYQDVLGAEMTTLLHRMILGEITPAEATAGLDAKLQEVQG